MLPAQVLTAHHLQNTRVGLGHRNGYNAHYRLVVNRQERQLLMSYAGVHGRAIGYPTPYEETLSPEQELTGVNPTIELMGQVRSVTPLQND